MIAYYRFKDGQVHEHEFDVKEDAPQRFFVDGRLSGEWFKLSDGRLAPRRAADPWTRHASLALACNPDDRIEFMEDAKKRGVETHFDRLGRPRFTSRNHQHRYLRAYDLVNRDDYR